MLFRSCTPINSSPGIPSFLPMSAPEAKITASYFSCNCEIEKSFPISTFPKYRHRGSSKIFSKTLETVLIFGWSGATPLRTNPQGVGNFSKKSTVVLSSFAKIAWAAKNPAGPAPTIATRVFTSWNLLPSSPERQGFVSGFTCGALALLRLLGLTSKHRKECQWRHQPLMPA